MVNKQDLAKMLAKKNRTTNNEELERINQLFETIEEELANGRSVKIVGFGAFSCVKRPPRTIVNPNTGEQFNVGAREGFKFVQGKHIRDIFKIKK